MRESDSWKCSSSQFLFHLHIITACMIGVNVFPYAMPLPPRPHVSLLNFMPFSLPLPIITMFSNFHVYHQQLRLRMEIKTFSYSTLLNLWHLIVFHFVSLLYVRGKSINSHREWKLNMWSWLKDVVNVLLIGVIVLCAKHTLDF